MGGMYGLSDLQRGNIEGLGPRENGEKVASELGVTMFLYVQVKEPLDRSLLFNFFNRG